MPGPGRPFEKGNRPPEAGRKRGTPNKVTRDSRGMIAQFVESRAQRAVELWDELAAKDPSTALRLYCQFAEFVLPKLGRTEHTGQTVLTTAEALAEAHSRVDQMQQRLERHQA